jgi:hypothetical protein
MPRLQLIFSGSSQVRTMKTTIGDSLANAFYAFCQISFSVQAMRVRLFWEPKMQGRVQVACLKVKRAALSTTASRSQSHLVPSLFPFALFVCSVDLTRIIRCACYVCTFHTPFFSGGVIEAKNGSYNKGVYSASVNT